MPKYRVYIDQTVQFHADVEAESEEEAEQKAIGGAAAHWIEYDRLKAEIREDLTEEIKEARPPSG